MYGRKAAAPAGSRAGAGGTHRRFRTPWPGAAPGQDMQRDRLDGAYGMETGVRRAGRWMPAARRREEKPDTAALSLYIIFVHPDAREHAPIKRRNFFWNYALAYIGSQAIYLARDRMGTENHGANVTLLIPCALRKNDQFSSFVSGGCARR